MDMLKNVTSMRHTNAHGEINFYKIEGGEFDATGFTPFNDKNQSGAFIVGHSESGHHHLLEAEGATVLEKEQGGMKLLYAILTKPGELKQDAASPHEKQIVEPGAYFIGTSLDYDPFTQQARRVAD